MSYFEDVIEPAILRVPNPHRMTKKERQIRSLRHGIWGSINGPINIKDMTEDHLYNALALVTRRNRDEVDKIAKEVLEKELTRRRNF